MSDIDKKLTIAVDFDGTCVTHEFPEIGKDIGAVPVLKELVEEGHNLILYTMRSNCQNNSGYPDELPEIHNGDHLDNAIRWFEDNEIHLYATQTNPDQFSWTSSPKCYANIYIDDAALGCPLIYDERLSVRPFVDWNKVRLHLVAMGVLKNTKL